MDTSLFDTVILPDPTARSHTEHDGWTPAIPSCRLCGMKLTRTLIDLGAMPLANTYVTRDEAGSGVDRPHPLHVRVCDSCLLAQVDTTIPPDAIFSDYAYFSSYSTSWVEHAARYATAMIDRFGLGPASRVMEVASNDGYLLRHFHAAGIQVLGIEPAINVAASARRIGIPTETVFFGADTAMEIAAQHGRADLIAANNVLAHVPDIFGFVAGFAAVLRPNGVVTFEFPHLLNLLEEVQFDTIYHEHYSYLSLLVVERVLRSTGLRAFDVERLPTHGGSLRVYACHAGGPHSTRPGLRNVRAAEKRAMLNDPDTYDRFAPKVAAVRAGFQIFLSAQRASGRRVAAYGAAAKGNTFLNFCGASARDIACIADRNPAKQGRLTPGSHIPIVAPEVLFDSPPDDVIILPWNLTAEVTAQLAPLRQAGTQFWIASPTMRRV
ncbi:MAG: methyltransferase domain-containing protein [Acetobacteraceae bacterium]